MHDLLISGGRVIDGTGSPWYWADIAIDGDQIVAVGSIRGGAARKTIDADGRIVSPGFIDMHTHSDLQPLVNPYHECKLYQGVTTDVIGHDGLGLAPATPETRDILSEQLAAWNGLPDFDRDWSTLTEYLDRFDGGSVVNVATLASQGTVRMAVVGMENREPTDAEMARMKAIIDQCMREGAIGLSTGLTYAPCMFASDDELVELCQVIQPYGGFYCPHHRNYGTEALKGYWDSIEIGRRAGVPTHLTHCHLSFEINEGRVGELIAMIDEARAAGVEVTMDAYPYLAGQTYLHAFLPSWAQEGGADAILESLQAEESRARLRHELEVTGSDGMQGVPLGWEMLRIGGILGDHDPAIIGMSLPDAATRAGKTPFDFFADLLVETRLGVSGLAFFGIEEHVQAIMRHPAHVVGSDGILVGGQPHPRGWGAHARFLSRYVRDLALLSWEEGIRKITSAPARRIGSLDRGIVRPGCKADIVVFDPDELRATATYDNPRSHAEGVSDVIVNGAQALADGQVTGATPGRALRDPYGRRHERHSSF
ncbi:MAG: D-aminoacylase [Chloroflexota bacterium]|nr:D-aminoacylase [Chloroflexota bacterium]MDE2910104.1 D-aminoacylase [Chloroflexota bacterium]